MTLSPSRIVLLLVAVAIVAALATLLTIGGVVVYAATRPTPTTQRAPVYVAPRQPAAPVYVAPRQPEVNPLQQQQQQRDIEKAQKAACDAQKRAYEAQLQAYNSAKSSGRSDPFLSRPSAPLC